MCFMLASRFSKEGTLACHHHQDMAHSKVQHSTLGFCSMSRGACKHEYVDANAAVAVVS